MRDRALVARPSAYVVAVCTALLLSIAAPAVAAGDGSPESPYEVPEVVSGIRVDGVLDEDVWEQALALDFSIIFSALRAIATVFRAGTGFDA